MIDCDSNTPFEYKFLVGDPGGLPVVTATAITQNFGRVTDAGSWMGVINIVFFCEYSVKLGAICGSRDVLGLQDRS